MLTITQESNLRLLFDPSSVPPGRPVTAAALPGEVDRLRAENDRLAGARAGAGPPGGPARPAERCAALEADGGAGDAARGEGDR